MLGVPVVRQFFLYVKFWFWFCFPCVSYVSNLWLTLRSWWGGGKSWPLPIVTALYKGGGSLCFLGTGVLVRC